VLALVISHFADIPICG